MNRVLGFRIRAKVMVKARARVRIEIATYPLSNDLSLSTLHTN